MNTQQVDIWVEYGSQDYICPVYDHVPERSWRHLDRCGYKTYIHAKVPGGKCDKDGILQTSIPRAHGPSRFTLMFQALAIHLLKQCSESGTAKILRISWDQAWHIIKPAVDRGLDRKQQENIQYLGIDEKSAKNAHAFIL